MDKRHQIWRSHICVVAQLSPSNNFVRSVLIESLVSIVRNQNLQTDVFVQFVASQTSHKDEEVEMYALKPSYSNPVSTNPSGVDKAKLAGEERLSDLRSSFTFPNGVLVRYQTL